MLYYRSEHKQQRLKENTNSVFWNQKYSSYTKHCTYKHYYIRHHTILKRKCNLNFSEWGQFSSHIHSDNPFFNLRMANPFKKQRVCNGSKRETITQQKLEFCSFCCCIQSSIVSMSGRHLPVGPKQSHDIYISSNELKMRAECPCAKFTA